MLTSRGLMSGESIYPVIFYSSVSQSGPLGPSECPHFWSLPAPCWPAHNYNELQGNTNVDRLGLLTDGFENHCSILPLPSNSPQVQYIQAQDIIMIKVFNWANILCAALWLAELMVIKTATMTMVNINWPGILCTAWWFAGFWICCLGAIHCHSSLSRCLKNKVSKHCQICCRSHKGCFIHGFHVG